LTRRYAAARLTATLLTVGVATAADAAGVRGDIVYIGVHGTQIHAALFDPGDGNLTALGPVANNPRPTWAEPHPRLPIVYFVNDSRNEQTAQGTIQAFRVRQRSHELELFAEQSAGDSGPTHLWLDARSRTLLVANFSGSVATLPLRRDGAVGERTSLVKFMGSGPHRRQTSAHAHSIALDPSGRYALVPDLGADRVWVLPFDRRTQTLGAYDPTSGIHFVAAPGSGPRHLSFHPGGRTVYLVNELTAMVDTLRWKAELGRLEKVQSISTDDPAYTGDRSAAEIAVSDDGRFVYVSNRGDHALVVFAVDRASQTLSLVQRITSGGARPWHFAIHRTGRWLIAANRDSDSLTIFALDRTTGRLSATGKSLAVARPVHVLFGRD
jgi:6-phosphogluconolactonase